MAFKRRFSFGKKLYFFTSLSVLIATVGTTLIAHFINADQIDTFYKDLAFDNAKNFASLVDVDFYKDFRALVESDEFTAVRNEAVEAEDESLIENFYKEHNVWAAYCENQVVLQSYLENMEQIKYLYIIVICGEHATEDMYLMDEAAEGLLSVGKYEAREDEFDGVDGLTSIEPTITNSAWGWLCSAYYPVLDDNDSAICMVGCDISMDDVHFERVKFFILISISVAIFITIVIFISMVFSQKFIVRPLSDISDAVKKFKAFSGADYDSAKVIKLKLKTNDEISDIYTNIRTMQISIVNYINEMSQLEREKHVVTAELNIASRIQLDMLPHAFDISEAIDLSASMLTAREVGGDFYDFFSVDDTHIAFVIADVSGKGVPASLMSVFVKSVIRSQVEINGLDTSKTMDVVNHVICKSNRDTIFTTVLLGILNTETGAFVYTNAGHEYPVLCKADGTVSLIESENFLPIGADDPIDYEQCSIKLENGDRLFLYTDGIPEAKSPDNKRFGMKFLISLLTKHIKLSSSDLITEIQNEVETFSGNSDLFDDSTMMTFLYKKQ